MPPIQRVSLIMTPLKLSWLRSNPVTTLGESEVGRLASSWGLRMCVTITIGTMPSLIIVRYGTKSTLLSVARLRFIVGSARCGSRLALPNPGKCLRQPMIPPSVNPLRYARPMFVTSLGSEPKVRCGRPGLLGFVNTSTMGIKLTFKPAGPDRQQHYDQHYKPSADHYSHL